MRQSETSAGDALRASPTDSPAHTPLVSFFGRVGEDYPFETAVEDAAREGFEFRFTWDDPTTAYEEVWEHPAAAAHNATLDPRSADILESFLFKLYALRVASRWDDAAPYLLVVGRVGNTSTYEIRSRECAGNSRGEEAE
jgi:hypothetical protein